MKNPNMPAEQDNIMFFPEITVQSDSEMDTDYFMEGNHILNVYGNGSEDDIDEDFEEDGFEDGEDSMLADLACVDAFYQLIIEWSVCATRIYDAISDAFEFRMSRFKFPSFTSILNGKHGCSIMGCVQENNMIFTIKTNRKISARMEANLHNDIFTALAQSNDDVQLIIVNTRACGNTVEMCFAYCPDDESFENYFLNPAEYDTFAHDHTEERCSLIERDIIDRRIKPILV